MDHVPDAIVRECPLEPDGCIKAHKAAVAYAAEQGWPSVWVIEDDCAFTRSFSRAKWEQAIAWTREQGYGVLVGGCVTTSAPKKIADGLLSVATFRSAHCVVYHQRAYPIAAVMSRPLDVNLGQLGAKPVVAVPFVAYQAPGYSANQKKIVDYGPMYRIHEEHLLRINRRRAR
jgi:hypothetical protein